MGPHISSYPPLGQITQLKDQNFHLIALLEVGKDVANDPWEVAVWYTFDHHNWSEKILPPLPSSDCPPSLQTINSSNALLYFCSPFFASSRVKFTLKFRNSHDQPWMWSYNVSGVTNGVVIINQEESLDGTEQSLSDFIHGINPDLLVKPVASQTPNTRLWTITATVGPAEEDRSTYHNIELGTPCGYMRYFALVRHALPWLGPRHGSDTISLDKNAVMCSFLNLNGQHLVLLGISDVANVMTLLRSSDTGSVQLHIRNDAETDSDGLVLAAVGHNFESAMAAVMYHARTIPLTTGSDHGNSTPDIQTVSNDVKAQWNENWYDGLGYCTWNALGQRLTDEKVIHAIETLAKNHINISSLIIDDNWQDIDYQGGDQYQHAWKGFEAEPTAFPHGLKDTVSRIRSKHPGIKHVAVWHALLGYWGGISSDSDLAKRYKTIQVDRQDASAQGPMTVIAKEDVGQFYNDFYQFLSDCGIDSVKADVQYMVDTWISAKHRRELTETYLDSWVVSALRYFSIKAISCMSQTPQLLFHQQLPHNKPAMVARNSDDFYPDVPDSHPWHIFANAHNTLLTQHLNILPDWDMFQTDHEFAGFHAAARCLSGGPIYITDVPGNHNLEIINQITGTTTLGTTVIFRPSVLGKSIDAYIGYDEPNILKIGCYNGMAVTGTPILGVFNTSRQYLREIIPLSRFPGVLESSMYVVRAHRSGFVTPALKPDNPTAVIPVQLDVRDYDILTAFPVTWFDSETNGGIHVANLGLIEKMTGAAAIMASRSELQHNGRVVLSTWLKALGVLGVYISCLPDMSIERDFIATMRDEPIPAHTARVSEADAHVLSIDIETAWKEMGLDSWGTSDIEVKVYFDIEHP